MKPFSHLHVHSHYSLLNALPKIPDLVARAKKDGMKALALTDNGNMYGTIEFYKECLNEGIKPVIGIDAYVAIRNRTDKQAAIDNVRYRLILLAKNETGYKNLITLVTKAHLEGFYYKPRIDKEILEKYSEGLICISPSFAGEIADIVRGSEPAKAVTVAEWYKKIFGDDFFIEITRHHEIESHEGRMKNLIKFALDQKIPLVAAHDVYYLDPEDKTARETLLSIQHGGVRERTDTERSEDFSFINQEKANELFADLPDALENVQTIVDRCDLKIELGKWVFPTFKVESGLSPKDELRRLTTEGLEAHGIKNSDEIQKRIDYEMEIICAKGYEPYFLVVADLIRFAHENKIQTNTRGSAAGSMVSFLTGITTVNPIEYNLPFERFLNPERPSPPDIDLDLADDRRDEVIEYARAKYGADKVAQIGTFGTMMARGAVRDVARALGYAYTIGDRIAKLIPMGSQGFPMTIDHAFELVPELKVAYDTETDTKEIIDLAKKIEGCARHISVHAAGVVISPSPLTDYTPLQLDTKEEGKIITQYDMYSIEEAGLLKFDFLGIKNLSIIADTLERIEAIEHTVLDITKIPIDDKKTFELLARGETEGLFQLNGDGMTRSLIDLRPTNINDINAMIALYRPGPMQNIPEYIERKHGKKAIIYLHPKMANFLKDSYGILVYQEDIMFTALELAGYTWKTVDKLRKAIGKKIPKEMAQQHNVFVEGCIKYSGISKEKAEKIWNLFEPFQGYGFNKAHAASYGQVAYQTAYLKTHYPAIYMSAVLTADSGIIEKIGEFINECKRMKIPVLPPSVNESYQGFSVVRKGGEEDKIRFGLTTIKNFGEGIADYIVKERKKNGPFVSLADFLDRIKDRNLNKKSLEALIKCGAMDDLGERGSLLANLEFLLEYHKERMQGPKNQDSLFGVAGEKSAPSISLRPAPSATNEDKLAWEKELLGLYISGHPLDKYRDKIIGKGTTIAEVLANPREGATVAIAGLVEEIRDVITKNNERMLFTRFTDLTGSIELVVFPRTLNEFKELFVKEKCLGIFAKISKRNGEVSLIAEKAKSL
jgi:DNA polymerase-3 subunit alpha